MEKDLSSRSVKYFREHLLQYILLVIIFVFGIGFLFQLESDLAKTLSIFALAMVYLFFGIFHHWEERNLTRTHVLEYLAISAFIFAVLYSLFVG
jgi:hypothetical protein